MKTFEYKFVGKKKKQAPPPVVLEPSIDTNKEIKEFLIKLSNDMQKIYDKHKANPKVDLHKTISSIEKLLEEGLEDLEVMDVEYDLELQNEGRVVIPFDIDKHIKN